MISTPTLPNLPVITASLGLKAATDTTLVRCGLIGNLGARCPGEAPFGLFPAVGDGHMECGLADCI